MLRQVFIIKNSDIIYQRDFGNALKPNEIEDLTFKMLKEAKMRLGKANGFFDFFKLRVAYDVNLEDGLDLIIVFVTGIMDDYFRLIKAEVETFKKEFLHLFADSLSNIDGDKANILNMMIDSIHRNLKPKISVVGFSGVGKTTIKSLIKMDEIPMEHIPTISGDIATIKIGKLFFRLFDFAGQEQFKYLWKGFIKGSCAILIVTDSTLENIEKSRFFLELVEVEAPSARVAIIGNKQDLPKVLTIDEIESTLGLKTYSMIANRVENRDKMTDIIIEILDMNIEQSPLVEEIHKKREKLADEQRAEEKRDKLNVEAMRARIKDLEKQNRKFANQLSASLDPNQVLGDLDNINKQIRYRNRLLVNLPLELCKEVTVGLKDNTVHELLKGHYQMIKQTIESIARGETYTYEDFYNNFEEYLEKDVFFPKVLPLRQFLESQFMLLETSIDKTKVIASKKDLNITTLVISLLIAYLSKDNSDKFPDFQAIVDHFKESTFSDINVDDLREIYLNLV